MRDRIEYGFKQANNELGDGSIIVAAIIRAENGGGKSFWVFLIGIVRIHANYFDNDDE